MRITSAAVTLPKAPSKTHARNHFAMQSNTSILRSERTQGFFQQLERDDAYFVHWK
jgi:hypothetical protein